MNFQNFLSVFSIWQINHYSSVKTTCPQKSGVQNIGSICRRNNNHFFVWFKTIHFYQNLIKCLFSFIVSSTHTRSSHSTHSVYFIYENNRGSGLLCQFEKISYTTCPYSDKHLY